ncbi:MAG: hypothetical protein ABIS14_11125 [Sphingomonas sp.]
METLMAEDDAKKDSPERRSGDRRGDNPENYAGTERRKGPRRTEDEPTKT